MERTLIVFQRLKELLYIPFSSRTFSENSEISDLLGRFEIFLKLSQKYKTNKITKQCNSLIKVKEYSKSEIIYDTDEVPKNIYFLLEGSVTLQYFSDMNNLNLQNSENIKESKSKILKKNYSNASFQNYGQLSKKISPSESFGNDLSFSTKNYQKHKAFAEENSVVGVLKIKVLQSLVLKYKESKTDELHSFIFGLDFFSS